MTQEPIVWDHVTTRKSTLSLESPLSPTEPKPSEWLVVTRRLSGWLDDAARCKASCQVTVGVDVTSIDASITVTEPSQAKKGLRYKRENGRSDKD